ncbi:hypothetical protein EDC01DRAFT_785049 [Geopyxis carbonaria]|nr:hypothetical protein EDC01DRAFT_785049 [Geopyxis carbonaria]
MGLRRPDATLDRAWVLGLRAINWHVAADSPSGTGMAQSGGIALQAPPSGPTAPSDSPTPPPPSPHRVPRRAPACHALPTVQHERSTSSPVAQSTQQHTPLDTHRPRPITAGRAAVPYAPRRISARRATGRPRWLPDARPAGWGRRGAVTRAAAAVYHAASLADLGIDLGERGRGAAIAGLDGVGTLALGVIMGPANLLLRRRRREGALACDGGRRRMEQYQLATIVK